MTLPLARRKRLAQGPTVDEFVQSHIKHCRDSQAHGLHCLVAHHLKENPDLQIGDLCLVTQPTQEGGYKFWIEER